jgi:DNA-binding response OmpR family regulator
MRRQPGNPVSSLTGNGSAKPSGPVNQPLGQKTGVLFVDPDPLTQVMMQLGLERNGFAVRIAPTGREALEIYREHGQDIAVLVLDVRATGYGGPQNLVALRDMNPNVPICVLCGNEDEYSPDMLLACGATYIVHKPFLMDELANSLRMLVQGVPVNYLPSGRASAWCHSHREAYSASEQDDAADRNVNVHCLGVERTATVRQKAATRR